MKNIKFFLSENFMFLEVKISIYLNRRVFVMASLIPSAVCHLVRIQPIHDKATITLVRRAVAQISMRICTV